MIGSSATLPATCQDSSADRVSEPIPQLADRSLKRSQVSLSVLLADVNPPPRPDELAAPGAAPETRTAACLVRPLRVLLVDDNRHVAAFLAVLLQSDGHDVCTARDGVAALRCVRAYRPEVVLLDIGLPGMSGCEVACRLRAREDTKHIFLAALTGYGRKDECDPFPEAGFDCHLVKPVELAELRRLLASVANGE
jgi:CheY-like chemotaxis protein